MKKFLTLLSMVLISFVINAQTLLETDFTGDYPPEGWSVNSHSSNWSAVNTAHAGGTSPELRFSYAPSFTGGTYFTSPSINTTGYTSLTFQFKHFIDHYGGPYTVGVATKANNGDWNTVWSIVDPASSMGAQEIVTINNSDVGSDDFQISFFFEGDAYNINYWYIDDVILFVPPAHDAMVRDVLIAAEYVAGTPFTPQVLIKNLGLNSESFDASCVIKLNGVSVYEQNCSFLNLDAGEEQIVSFPEFTPSVENDLYEVTVTTNLSGDLDNTNDSKTEDFDTYTTERNLVILEIGTGTWCPYCPGASMGAHDLIENDKAVGVIKYHSGDTFTNSYSDARIDYYGISAFPTAIFDGVESIVGGSNTESMYPVYLPIYEARKAKNSAFTVEIIGQNDQLDYSLTIRVSKLANIPVSYNNLVLHLVLTESEIPFEWQGQTEINYTERLMAPDENGTVLDFSSSDVVEIDLNFTMDPSWVKDNCELVAFIQNQNGHEILQGSKVSLPDLPGDYTGIILTDIDIPAEFELEQNYPNPFNPSSKIKFSVPQLGLVSIVVYDLTGQKVATLLNEIKEPGRYEINFNGAGLSSGVYFYRMTAGNFTQVKKMIILK